ncbi:outer membrane protein assembly factor BamA [Benzoatithermus flavus]|uniref:Outer membrane protein assembly factor BamA n=1 Tax=Benzoatithermus flavus TaxID=3108223 RepID=A0ABU8XKA5_9PROT
MMGFRRLSLVGAAVALLVLQPGLPVLAQQQQESGGVIRRIVVEGNQRIEPSTVESYLAVRPGDPFDPQKLDESLKSLFATGLFDDVSLDRQGDTLVVKVVENPIINRIAFEGNKRLDDKTLEAEIQLRPRVVYTRARVQNAVNRILELYRRNGRYAAKVEPKIIELDQNRVDLVFEISEGPVTRVGGIAFIGNEKFSDSTLRGVVQTKESAWYRFFTSDDTYDPDRLSFDQELLRRFYYARGYADFQVVSAVAELTPDGQEFFITFTVEEGPQYKFGKIDIDTTLRDLSPDQLRQFVETRSGEIYNADQIEATIQKLTDEVGRLGYAFVNIDPKVTKHRDDLTIDLTYAINEGPRVYVERIDIEGNVRTLDEVIRREFRLAEGDAFNTALLRRSQQRLRNLGFFETVDIKTEPGSAPDKIVIKTKVTERSTGELSFGAGYSTQDGVLGDVRLRERNLLGRGQDLTANFTVSQRRQNIEFSFTEPYFLERDLAAGFDIFRSRTDFQSEASFDETSTGGTLRLGYPLTENLRHAVRYTYRVDDIHNVDRDASIFIRQEEGGRSTSLVGQTFTYDRRDVRFLPSEGYYLRLDQDVAGLGGDNRFLRHEGRADFYYPFFPDVVLNLGASAGYIFGFGGEDVHLANRFFIGGNTLRGFRFGGIGPRDKETDDKLGGNLYYVGTAELRFPLGLPSELRIFGRTFVDAGTLEDIDVSGPTLDENKGLRASAGVGLSWLSPLGPLSIDVSQPFLKQSHDETEVFRLSFGTRF